MREREKKSAMKRILLIVWIILTKRSFSWITVPIVTVYDVIHDVREVQRSISYSVCGQSKVCLLLYLFLSLLSLSFFVADLQLSWTGTADQVAHMNDRSLVNDWDSVASSLSRAPSFIPTAGRFNPHFIARSAGPPSPTKRSSHGIQPIQIIWSL